jgi:hypothetical protein
VKIHEERERDNLNRNIVETANGKAVLRVKTAAVEVI